MASQPGAASSFSVSTMLGLPEHYEKQIAALCFRRSLQASCSDSQTIRSIRQPVGNKALLQAADLGGAGFVLEVRVGHVRVAGPAGGGTDGRGRGLAVAVGL